MKELLKNLIASAPCPENGEYRAARVLLDFFERYNVPSQIDQWDTHRANVIASIGPDNPQLPALVIGAHLDVVPAAKEHWASDPFLPVEKGGKIYGRGAVDMLGGLCAAVHAMCQLHAEGAPLNGRVILSATAGEETDSCGAKRFVEQARHTIGQVIGILIPEPTGLKIMRAHRGILWLKIETFGKTAHGSMPHLGINAIQKMNALLDRLENWKLPHTPHPLLGGCSVSPNRIAGGSATNIVPDHCFMEIDIRTLPGQRQEDIIKNVQRLINELAENDPDFRASVSILRTCSALETPHNNPFVQAVCRVAGINETHATGFTTDGPLFAQLNAPVVILGPGDGTLCHKSNEAIEIDALDSAQQMYKKIIRTIFT